ncbi:hypothetical protein [Candidatus Lariskella endosymbiont of Epinotia ramella]|uniref:hypothetical protein n=1 Tax=Candidatus Lariskella endosymbiont of Epinotia ramella TaxID=3066224 RepID=UPI0030CDDA6B
MKTEKNKKINEAIDLLIEGGADLKTVLKQDGLIKELTKSILERALQAEMSERVFLIDCVNFLEPLKSPIKFDYKMSHSFIPVRDRHGPFFGNIINR